MTNGTKNMGRGEGRDKGWGPNLKHVGPRRVGPRRVGLRRVGGPKISLFFSPAAKFVLSSLSGGFLVEFWWCLKRWDPLMCTFGVLLLSCEAPAAPKPPGGVHTTAREPERAHERVPAIKNTTKIPREDPQRERKRTKMRAGEGKQ